LVHFHSFFNDFFLKYILERAAGKGARINYKSWLTKTSIAHNVILEGWPEDLPHNPKTINKGRLDLVFDDLVGGKIFYRKMTANELETQIKKSQPIPSITASVSMS
jgi:hypothetical protein